MFWQGKNMKLGAQLVDYTVLIGFGRCVVTNLTDNVLRCQPPIKEPATDTNTSNWCVGKQMNSVMVRTNGMCASLHNGYYITTWLIKHH